MVLNRLFLVLIQWRILRVSLLVLLAVVSFLASAAWAKDKPKETEVTLTVPGFQEMLIATSKTSPGEMKQLETAMAQYFEQADPVDTSAFKNFLKDHPQSAWRVAVQLNLGLVYYQNGAFSDAIAVWEDAWEAGKNADGLMAKVMVDRAFGELIRMRARLGHADQIEQLLKEAGDRVFVGPASELVAGAKSGLGMMRDKPELAFLCGPNALGNVLFSQHPDTSSLSVFDHAYSTERGVTLKRLYELADEIPELDYVGAYRQGDSVPIPTPAVIHWKLNHYAAILSEKNGQYHIKDPTFGGDLWISKKVLNKEASGYFMIPKAKMDTGWRIVDNEEAELVYGMGTTTVDDPGGTGPCDSKSKSSDCCCDNGPPSGGQNPAMPNYDVHSMLVSLNITDTPLSYTPPRGGSINFTLTYNQREMQHDSGNPYYFNFGKKWVFNWLAFITDDPLNPGNPVRRAVAGGGYIDYSTATLVSGEYIYGAEELQGAILVKTGSNIFERRLKNGGKEVYGHSNGDVIGFFGPLEIRV